MAAKPAGAAAVRWLAVALCATLLAACKGEYDGEAFGAEDSGVGGSGGGTGGAGGAAGAGGSGGAGGLGGSGGAAGAGGSGGAGGTGGAGGAGGTGGSTGPQPTIESVQSNVFTPRCVSCHAGSSPSGGMRLDNARTSYNNLVNVRAQQFPLQFRVAPGNPDDSYLIDKLEGTQSFGGRMPLNQQALPQASINVIRQWISDGAPPPASQPQSLFVPADGLPE